MVAVCISSEDSVDVFSSRMSLLWTQLRLGVSVCNQDDASRTTAAAEDEEDENDDGDDDDVSSGHGADGLSSLSYPLLFFHSHAGSNVNPVRALQPRLKW